MRDRIVAAAAVVVMVCSITVSSVYVYSQIGRSPRPMPSEPRIIRQWREIAAAGVRMGPTDAPVTIVEFADYQRPACKELHRSLEPLRHRHPDQIALVFRKYPLSAIRPFAGDAALASLCAARQNRFAEMHDLLFAKQDLIGKIAWEELGRRTGVSTWNESPSVSPAPKSSRWWRQTCERQTELVCNGRQPSSSTTSCTLGPCPAEAR